MEYTLAELRPLLHAVTDAEDRSLLDGDILDVPLTELGCDSLALLDIAAAIEKARSISVPDATVHTLTTPRRLLDFVNQQAAS